MPLLAGRGLVDGAPAAYVCRQFTCLAPVTTPEQLTEALTRPHDLQPGTPGSRIGRLALYAASWMRCT